jgi:hypothetical protein
MTNSGGRRRPLRTLLLLAVVLVVSLLALWFGYKALMGSPSDVTVRTGPVGQKELQGEAAPAEVAPTAMTPAQTAQPAVIGAIEAKVGLARVRVEAVASEAVRGEDRPDVAVVVDGAGVRRCRRWRRREEKRTEHKRGRHAPKIRERRRSPKR